MIAAAVIIKNESANILEWLAYHSVLGIQKFIIYDNESKDETADVVRRAGQFYDIDLVPWPSFYQRTTQIFAYRDACFRLRTQPEVEWCAFIDADEYLLSTTGARIQDLTTRCRDADAICLNWTVFGSSGHVKRPPGLMIDRFCYRAPLDCEINNPIKSIVRPGAVLDCANPHFFYVPGTYVDSNNEPARINETENGTVGQIGVHEWRVNHYAAKSREQWLERIARGQCGQIVVGEERWNIWDRNDEHDMSAPHYYGAATRNLLAQQAARQRQDVPRVPQRVAPDPLGPALWAPNR